MLLVALDYSQVLQTLKYIIVKNWLVKKIGLQFSAGAITRFLRTVEMALERRGGRVVECGGLENR